MKKIILALVMMAFCMSRIDAQIHFGIKGGVNFDGFSYRDAQNLTLEKSTGWQAGALLLIKIPKIGIGVQPELLYTVSRATASNNRELNAIHYFEVPINLHLGLDLKFIRPYFQLGPYFGYALKTDGSLFRERIDKTDWGIGLGAGLDLWKFQFCARYSWGLHNVAKVSDFELKNKKFTLSLGFLFK